MQARSQKLDSVKGFAIILVVFGHFIENYRSDFTLVRMLYGVIYAFHIPLLVFASGTVSKLVIDRTEASKIIRRIIAPLVVFNLLYMLVGMGLTGNSLHIAVTPYWLMWFLASLACWRMALPLFASKRGLMASIVIAIVAGWSESIGYPFSLSRTLYFMPFFVAGHLYGQRLISSTQGGSLPWKFACLCVGAIIALIVATTIWKGLPVSIFYGAKSYPAGQEFAFAAIRTLALAGAAALVFVAFHVIPSGFAFLAFCGTRSLSIYLLHGFLVMIWKAQAINASGTLEVIALATIATIATIAISCAAAPITDLVSGRRLPTAPPSPI